MPPTVEASATAADACERECSVVAMARRLLHLFTSLNGLGTTVVVATHDVGLISATPGARIIRLEGGSVSDPTGVLKNPPPAEFG